MITTTLGDRWRNRTRQALRQENRPSASKECECGNPKSVSAFACPRCTYLDGEYPARQFAIEALRTGGAMTLVELCVAVYGAHTHSAATGMLRVMQRLVRQERVRRYWADGDPRTGGGWHGRDGAHAGHWVYVLSGRTERP